MDYAALKDQFTKYVMPITAVTAFIGSTAGFLAAASSGSSFAWACLIAATVVVGAWNAVLKRRSKPRRPGPAFQEQPGARRKRRLIHGLSALLMLALWTGGVLLTLDRTAPGLLRATLGCDAAIKRLEAIEKPRFGQRIMLLDCYDETQQLAKEAGLSEAMLDDPAVWRDLPEGDRIAEQARLHAKVGLLYLTSFSPGLPSDPEAALRHFRRSVRLIGDSPLHLALLAFGVARNFAPGREELVTEYDDVVARAKKASTGQGPQDKAVRVQTSYWIGRSLLAAGRHDEAETMLQDVIALSRQPPADRTLVDNAHAYLGQAVLQRTGDMDAARKIWASITREEALTNAALTEALITLKKEVDATAAGDQAAAKAHRAEVVRLADVLERLDKGGDRKLGLGIAVLDYQLGRYANALARFKTLHAQEPGNRLTTYWYGRSLFASDAFEEARKVFAALAADRPDDADALEWLGRSELMLGRDDAALKAVTRSLDLAPDNDKLHILIVSPLVNKADPAGPQEKARLYEEALRHAGTAIDLSRRDGREAPQDFLVIRAHMQNAVAYSYAEQGIHLALAARYVDEALETIPQEPSFMDTKAYVLIRAAASSNGGAKARQLAQAQDLLEQALKKFPHQDRQSRATSLAHLAAIAKARNDSGRATEYAMQALDLDPTNQDAQRLANEQP